MSLRAILWAFDQQVFSASSKLTLLALANFSSDNGKSWPGMETIREMTNLDEKTIRGAIEKLIELSLLEDTGKRVGSTGKIKVYQLPSKAWTKPGKTEGLQNEIREQSGSNPGVIPPKTVGLHASANIVLTGNREQGTLYPLPPLGGNRFEKPTLEQIKLAASKTGLSEFEAERFFNYYESNGWKVGRNPMKSLPHALANWRLGWEERNGKSRPAQTKSSTARDVERTMERAREDGLI